MELFKIIKKVFDLTRNEVQQVLKDSKAYAKSLVDAEATRADAKVNNLETSIKDDLYHKVGSSLYIKTTDISNEGELSGEIDAEFLEWNILRRVFTQGVVGKTNYLFSFLDSENAQVDIKPNTFFELPDTTYKGVMTVDGVIKGGVKYLYNVQLYDVNYSSVFKGIGAKCISCKNINDNYTGSCESMFSSCSLLEYIDFRIPSKASNYSSVFYNCRNLVHKDFEINWPNATDVSKAFYGNREMHNDMSSKLNVTLRNVTSMSYMFYDCQNLRYVGNVYSERTRFTTYMFKNCIKLESVDSIEILDDTEDLREMFYNCNKLTTVRSIKIEAAMTIKIDRMFYTCKSLISAPEIPGIINTMSGAFSYCESLKSIPLYKVTNNLNLGIGLTPLPKLTELGGFEGLSIGVNIGGSPLLTRESCLNLFNYASTVGGVSGQSFRLHHEAYARLSEEDIAIAVNKGWTVASV